MMWLLASIVQFAAIAQCAAAAWMSTRRNYEEANAEDGPLPGIWVYRGWCVLWLLIAIGCFAVIQGL